MLGGPRWTLEPCCLRRRGEAWALSFECWSSVIHATRSAVQPRSKVHRGLLSPHGVHTSMPEISSQLCACTAGDDPPEERRSSEGRGFTGGCVEKKKRSNQLAGEKASN